MKNALKDPPLILLHGYPFDHSLWHATIASMGAGIRIFAPDLPGFGKTPALEAEPSMDAMADWVAEYMDERGLSSAVVAGMSMGGYVALAFAERHPKRLLGLGLISTQAAADSEEARQGREAMIKRIAKEGPVVAAEAVSQKMFGKSKSPKPELLEYPRDGAVAAGAKGLTWALRAMANRPDRSELVRSLELPVFFAHGREDQIVPLEKAQQLADTSRDPHYVSLKYGHATPLESPDYLAAGLVKFMDHIKTQASSKRPD